MTTAAIISVRPVDDDTTCRQCGRPIERGRRGALLLGTGLVHLRCLLGRHTDDTNTDREPER